MGGGAARYAVCRLQVVRRLVRRDCALDDDNALASDRGGRGPNCADLRGGFNLALRLALTRDGTATLKLVGPPTGARR